MYYKIGIINKEGDLIGECVTEAPLYHQIVLGKVTDVLKENYKEFASIVYNQRDGEMPSGMNTIKVKYKDPDFKYNK